MTTRKAVLVAAREVGIETAGRETLVTVLPFVVSLVVLAGVGFGPRRETLAAVAPALVWLVVLVAALPLASGVAAAERHDDAWDLLRALAPPTAVLAGKLAAMWLWLLACWAVASLLAVALLEAVWVPVAAVGGLLGTFGVAVTTVALGVLLPHGTRRPGLLAVLLLPGALPVLLAGAQIASGSGPWLPWVALLVAYDLATLVAAWAVFPTLLEE